MLIHLLIDEHLTCIVDFLSAINFASLDIDVQISIYRRVFFTSLGYIVRNGIAWS